MASTSASANLFKRAGSPTSANFSKCVSATLFPSTTAAAAASGSPSPACSPARNYTATMAASASVNANSHQNSSMLRRACSNNNNTNNVAASYFYSAVRAASTTTTKPQIGLEPHLVKKDDPHHEWVKHLLSAKPPSASSSASNMHRSFSSTDFEISRPINQKSATKKRSASAATISRNVEDFFKPKMTPGRNIDPQLAHVWEDHHHRYDVVVPKQQQQDQDASPAPAVVPQIKDEGLMASLKLDGIRATFQLKSTKGMNVPIRIWRTSQKRIVALSRHHKEFYSVSRISSALEPLFNKYPELILDGEIYVHGVDFNELSGAIRSQEAIIRNSGITSSDDDDDPLIKEAVKNAKTMQKALQFHIFDIAYHGKCDVLRMDYTERMRLLRKILRETIEPKRLAVPAQSVASDFEDQGSRIEAFKNLVDNFEDAANNFEKIIVLVDSVKIKKADVEKCRRIVAKKVEGLMIRHPRSPYTYGRSPNLLKVKKMHDSEYKIVGFKEGKGQLKGHLGAFILKAPNGQKFHATLSAPSAVKKGIWLTKSKYLGHWATVQYQDISSKGVPRFPVAKTIRGKSKQDFV